MMYEIERAIPTPQVVIIVQRRARRQVFRNRPLLTTGGENVHEPVHDLAHDHCALVAAAFADQRFDQFPFVLGEVAGMAQMAAVIPRAIFHSSTSAAAPKQATSLVSEMIHRIQLLPGQTLRNDAQQNTIAR